MLLLLLLLLQVVKTCAPDMLIWHMDVCGYVDLLRGYVALLVKKARHAIALIATRLIIASLSCQKTHLLVTRPLHRSPDVGWAYPAIFLEAILATASNRTQSPWCLAIANTPPGAA